MMRPRLNVTEAERLCYSRRKLQAISALRGVGIDPSICGLHKEHRLPGARGNVYLVQHPGGPIYAFQTLAEIHTYAAEEQAWKAHRFTWKAWLQAPVTEPVRYAACAWPDCKYQAHEMIERQPYCRGHAYVYERMLVASSKRASTLSRPRLP